MHEVLAPGVCLLEAPLATLCTVFVYSGCQITTSLPTILASICFVNGH